eukprot:6214357-Pleurochrysis_carterae.AAC.1
MLHEIGGSLCVASSSQRCDASCCDSPRKSPRRASRELPRPYTCEFPRQFLFRSFSSESVLGLRQKEEKLPGCLATGSRQALLEGPRSHHVQLTTALQRPGAVSARVERGGWARP